MQEKDFTATILVDQKPQDVFTAINNVAAWWTGEPGVDGSALKLGDLFTYRYKDIHYSKQEVIELVPSSKIVWLVTESELSFVKKKDEWTRTKIIFEISEKGGETEVRFIHAGLVEDLQCFNDCSNAWSSYIKDSLKKYISAAGIPVL